MLRISHVCHRVFDFADYKNSNIACECNIWERAFWYRIFGRSLREFKTVEVLAIVVRYQMPLSQSPALHGLCNALISQQELAESYTVMVWDNSQEPEANLQFPVPVVYHHSAMNLGVSGAYNGAMHYAVEHGHAWMLLLDQDTKITREFLSTMLRHSRQLQSAQEIAAIVPTVRFGEIAISPSRRLLGRNRGYPAGECGIAPGEASAINSGCFLRVKCLQTIGGFSVEFWLDFSDLYIFHQFYVNGLKVWRAGDAEIQHDMTTMDYRRLMTPWRCRDRANAETAFNDLYYGRLENLILTFRVLLRAVKHRVKYENREFSRIAWNQFLYRLRVPRSKRTKRWLAEGKERQIQ